MKIGNLQALAAAKVKLPKHDAYPQELKDLLYGDGKINGNFR